MEQKLNPLKAIYKKGTHVGNVRAYNANQAIKVYLLESGYSTYDLNDAKLLNQFHAISAEKNIHF